MGTIGIVRGEEAGARGGGPKGQILQIETMCPPAASKKVLTKKFLESLNGEPELGLKTEIGVVRDGHLGMCRKPLQLHQKRGSEGEA